MFDEFLKSCPMDEEIKPSKKRVEKNIAAVKSLIETNDEVNNMTKRKFRLKPLMIAAVIAIFSGMLLLTTNAAMQGALVKFTMGGEEIEGEYYDYVDSKGFRHISFGAVLPLYEENFAIIYDVDAPQGENVRVITDETDPDFMNKLRQYKEAKLKYWDEKTSPVTDDKVHVTVVKGIDPNYPQPEDFGLVFKDSELCTFRLGVTSKTYFEHYDGNLGGEFMHTGHAYGSGVGDPNECSYDWENETKTYKHTFYYYVGKE